jgi:hypothetical protein
MTVLPHQRACELARRPSEQQWLIDGLWAEQAVGIIGGEPKCCKSFLALDLAVAVASGTAALRHFRTPRPGRVLLYAAEDALHVVRQRLDGICAAVGVPLSKLDIRVITAPTLRLDLEAHRQALADTMAQLQPRMLILDPFVRLHRVDENASGEIAPLLAFLRELQRRYQSGIAVVHHAKKGAAHARAGQALRGSSEFHAWGDSNLYLRRHGEQLMLTIEHRAAASPPPLALALTNDGDALALRVAPAPPASNPLPSATLAERVTGALSQAGQPLSVAELRKSCRIRTATLCALLAELAAAGTVRKTAAGYLAADR